MSIREIQQLSKQLQKAIDESEHPRAVKPIALNELPPDIAELFCVRCHQMISVLGCPKHPLRQAALPLLAPA